MILLFKCYLIGLFLILKGYQLHLMYPNSDIKFSALFNDLNVLLLDTVTAV